jgi:murein L,D-transpeptidase YcbB/YkuD
MNKKTSSKVIAVILVLVVVVTIDIIVKKPFFASAKDHLYDLLHSKDKIHIKGDSERINSRDFLSKYYDFFGYKQLWTDSTRQNDKYRDMLISMLQHADSLGLDRKDYHQDYIVKFDSLSHLPNFDYAEYESENELIFTDAALTFLYHVAYGKEINIGFNGVKYNIDSTRILNVFKDLLVSGDWRKTLDSLEPRTMQYVTLKTELNRMNTCLRTFPQMDTAKITADVGSRAMVINKLKAYGVIDEAMDNDSVTGRQLKTAIKGFQKIMGTDTSGNLDDKTIAALNFRISKRASQIKESLNDWRWTGRLKEREFILVNIPAARLQIVKSDTTKDISMKVIVGKLATQTPSFTSYITGVTTYPYWVVPFSIATKEMLPKIRKRISYLDDNNLQVLDGKGNIVENVDALNWNRFSPAYFPYTIRQSTGCDNSLGVLKFDLNSPYSIYLHDTNAKGLFSQKNRFLSHGCVRLEKPMVLAEFVLREGLDTGTVNKLNQCMADQKPTEFRLKRKLPVLILYMTADIDESGNLKFYTDVYGVEEKKPENAGKPVAAL